MDTTISAEAPPPGTSNTDRSSLEIWQGLDAVQNLFAANLPWYESKLGKAGLSDASRSSLLDFRTFFRFDIRQLSMSLRSSHLSSLSHNQTQDLSARVAKVLHLLETRTDEQVLILPPSQREGLPKIKTSADEGGADTSSIFWPFSGISGLFTRNNSPVTKQSQSKQSPPPSPYPKLKALQSLLCQIGDDADPVFKYGHLINLGDGPDEYHQVLHEIEELNAFIMGLGDADTSASPGLKPRGTPTDRGDDLTREASSRLFTALVHSPVECGQPHRGLLHLTGFRSKERVRMRPSWDMFLSCCSHPLGWVETRCTVRGPPEYTDAEKLDDLCGSVQWHRQHTGDALCLRLGGEQLFHVRDQDGSLKYPDFDQPLSLDTLLGRGYFRSAYDGGLFTPRSKRLLVVNLARCLLSLHNTKWLQREWNACDVLFLFDTSRSCLLDMHRPYLPATLSLTIPPLREVRNGPGIPHHPAILSFAKLLVEIERGRKIAQEEYETTNGNPNDWLTISTILTRQLSGSLTGYYLSAMQACLDFSRPTGYGSQDPVEYIFERIVTPLETELSHYIFAEVDPESAAEVELPLPQHQNPPTPFDTLRSTNSETEAESEMDIYTLSRAATSGSPFSDRDSPLPQDDYIIMPRPDFMAMCRDTPPVLHYPGFMDSS